MSKSEVTEPDASAPAVETVEEVDTAADIKGERKRARHRKKQLFERILKQMEFYFSDANLTKDRFLGELTRTDPDVPLDIFLRFNKIRSMTLDVRDIAKALKGSTLLECIDKTKVRRVTPLVEYDAEARTVYVEGVPATANRDWLQSVFSEHGNVAYISLPEYRNSNRNKGFAFVEYSTADEATKCITAFAKKGCKLPTCMPPEHLSTIKTFEEEHTSKPEENLNETPNTSGVCENAGDMSSDDIKLDRKRPAENSLKNENGEPPKKKKKSRKKKNNNENMEPSADVSVNETKESAGSGNERDTGVSSQSETEHANNAGEQDKKKCRKRTAKERNKAKNKSNSHGLPANATLGLQVLAKAEWRALRNKYLNLQRKNMRELKNKLRAQGAYQQRGQTVGDAHQESKRRQDESKLAADATARARFHKPDGVFVRVELPEPCLDVRLTKRQVRSNVHVQHVDVREGERDMTVRFDTPEHAAQYCASGVYAAARTLTTAECAAEWERAERTRAQAASARRPRGRARLLERATAAARTSPAVVAASYTPSAHIRFDD